MEGILDANIKKIYDRLGLAPPWKKFSDEIPWEENFLGFCNSAMGRRVHSIWVLFAHAGDDNGRWFYENDEKQCFVQDWMLKNDGKYDALLLHACNPAKSKPKMARSITVVPQGNISVKDGVRKLIHYVDIPGLGVVPYNGEKMALLPEYSLFADLVPHAGFTVG